MYKMKKAQLSYEYLVIIGSILILLLPFFYKFMEGVSSKFNDYYATETVNVLAEATKTVANLGARTQVTIPLTIKSVKSSDIIKDHITLNLPTGDITARGAKCIGSSPDTLQGTGTFYTPVAALPNLIAVGDGPIISNIIKKGATPNYNSCFEKSEINTNDEFDIYGANLGEEEETQQVILTRTDDKSNRQFRQGDTIDRDGDGRTDFIRLNPITGATDYYVQITDKDTGRYSNIILLKVTPPGQGRD